MFFDLYGEGVTEEPKGVLSIHKESGTMSVHKAVDYEQKKVLKVRLHTDDLQCCELKSAVQ